MACGIDSQGLWLSMSAAQGRRRASILVIHLGMQFLRISRMLDVSPITVPHVIARRSKVLVLLPVYMSSAAGQHGR